MSQNHDLQHISWDDFKGKTPEEKAPYVQQDGRPSHVLIAQQFDRSMLDRLSGVATMTRRVAKTKGGMNFLQGLLSEKRAMMYFVQPSTRTFLSFQSACQILGIQTAEVRDTATSSELKGESQEDSVRTFSSYVDMIIMRHPQGGFSERVAWILSNSDRSIPVVNAGSGKDQHPTQALLDVYTLQRSFENRGGIDGKSIAFVGDLARGRTVRSLVWLLQHYEGVKLYFIAPDLLQIGEDVLAHLDRAGVAYEVTDTMDPVLPAVDAVYMTRLQDEWDKEEGREPIDISQYYFTSEHLEALKKDAVILHPLPRRREIAVEVDQDPRAVYWRQVRNGMWIRAALILTLFRRDEEVVRYNQDLMR